MIPENWAEKAPPPQWGNNFLTPDLSISGNFEQLWFWWQKSPPPIREIFHTRSIHFRQFWATLVFVAEKSPPPPPHEGKFFDTRSINFREFWATLVLVAEKPTPHPDEGIFFDTRSIHFRQFWATLVLVAENLPSPDEGKFFDTRSIHFRQFRATLVLVEEKTPPMREKILTPDLSISGNFKQLWFWWKKSPPKWGEIFLHWIYPLQTILSNFGFCGRKAPLSFVPFHERHNSCYPCGIPMVPILQICTQIPPIWISSLGY